MRLAFIGGGTMAEAIIGGVLSKEVARPEEIVVGELLEERRRHLQQRYRVTTTGNNLEGTL